MSTDVYKMDWKDGCLFEAAGRTPSYVSHVRYAHVRAYRARPMSVGETRGILKMDWKDGCLFEAAGRTPSYVSHVRYAHVRAYRARPMSVGETRGILKMASPSKHVLLLTNSII